MRNFRGPSASFFFIFLLVVSAAAWQSSEDCVLRGTVTYFGDSNRSGLSVKAFIGELEVAYCESKDGQYELRIPPDDPATPHKKEGWVEGDVVVVKVNQIRADVFEASGGVHPVDLVVSASNVPNWTTWGKIKALFK